MKKPPRGLVLSSEDEARCAIPIRNSFATVRELQRRANRCDSLLNRGAFLLTSEPEILGMTQASLEKFKAGLQHAFHLADQLADIATKFSPIPGPNHPVALTQTPYAPFPSPVGRPRAATTTLRHAQIAHLRMLPSRGLAWLVTLAAGASKGYQRYSARLLETDPAMADARVMAFKEVLLRYGGSLVVWGFMRGTGSLAGFVKQAVAHCAEEVLFFEEGGQVSVSFAENEIEGGDGSVDGGVMNVPAGLHMTLMKELARRIELSKRAEAEDKGDVWDEEQVDTSEVWDEVHKLVAQEVGCQSWRGYAAIKYPYPEDGAA